MFIKEKIKYITYEIMNPGRRSLTVYLYPLLNMLMTNQMNSAKKNTPKRASISPNSECPPQVALPVKYPPRSFDPRIPSRVRE